ncbi:inorganic diphosphatase [Schizosaccharomyces japonicus yFS275]|uniref:inorganic diphosphatase n=1 Tax=Schizosaccharomyces japonicus (strain yFS275 / FY16936) TaxID=402676 RepID=B6JZ51_SCHJY|nr:inorganic diphosphatase [Schizosaccharomyces japonicus yFS275]EEB06819.1 inorganic diphosphatase [Schizosaccharomyces japonicus yFS275]
MSNLARSLFKYQLKAIGRLHTPEFRVYCMKEGKPVSYLHDVPIASDEKTFNMIVEIPRWTQAKCEIAIHDPLQPIRYDMKNDKIRYVPNCFPFHGYIWNYGVFPQSWENQKERDQFTGLVGDGDPLDVCDIGGSKGKTGQIKQVKLLGALALIDQGETDWKIIVIDTQDPLAEKMNDIQDAKRYMPGLLESTKKWFSIYKVPDGKPKNHFALNGQFLNQADTLQLVKRCHESWRTSKLRQERVSERNEQATKDLAQSIIKAPETFMPDFNYPSQPYCYV